MLPVLRRRNDTARNFWGLGTDFDRLFDAALNTAPSMSGWTPAVDVAESNDGYTVTAELPGLDPKEVEITVENGVLSISGEKRDEFEDTDTTGRHLVERRYGRFQRNFSLPRSVDADGVEAHFDNGLLTVTLPKAERAKPRRIKIG